MRTQRVEQCPCGIPIFFAYLPPARATVAFEFDPSDMGYAVDWERSDLSRGIVWMDKGYYRKGSVHGAGEPIFKQHQCSTYEAQRAEMIQRSIDEQERREQHAAH